MKNDFEKNFLFACPIYKIKIDPNSYDKEKILKDIKYNKSLKNTRNDPHQNLGGDSNTHHSLNDFDNENFRHINYEKLRVVYLEIFKEFFGKEIHTTKEFKFNSEFKFEFCFVNYSAMSEGQRLAKHSHLPYDDFATVHYLNFKDDHSLTRFINPGTFGPYLKSIRPGLSNILQPKALDNSYMWEYCEFPAEEDDMLIFPSAVLHEVLTQGPTKEPRITISTNLKINLS